MDSRLPYVMVQPETAKTISTYRGRYSRTDHLLDRIKVTGSLDMQKVVTELVEMLGSPQAVINLLKTPAIASFSYRLSDVFSFDFHPLSEYLADTRDENDWTGGFVFQMVTGKNRNCELSGIYGVAADEDGREYLDFRFLYANKWVIEHNTEAQMVKAAEVSFRHFIGVQYLMLNRPVEVHERIDRITVRNTESKPGKNRKRQVRMVKTVYLNSDEICAAIKKKAGTRVIGCPCWGVIGHWRTYKSGKKVWIKPYRKGKERDKRESYSPKEYLQEEQKWN